MTLLLASNASGDPNLEPMLMYNSGNLRLFKQQRVIKGELGAVGSPTIRMGY
jgi:hypothetical protein